MGESKSGRAVLVTGPTGFVGRHLVAGLAATGRPLTLATRRAELPPVAGARAVTVGAVGPETDWGDALDGVGAVVHLAAHVHVAPERAEAEADVFRSVNAAGTLRLYEAAERAGVPLLVFVSSINALGSATRPGEPFTDATTPRPETVYGRSKLAAEEALRARAPGSRTALVILRPPLICGPGVKGNLASLIRLSDLPVPLPLGGIANRRTLLSVDNLVGMIRRILDGPAPGTYVVGDTEPVSTSDIVRHLREGLGRSPLMLPAPATFLRAAAALVRRPGLSERLLGDLHVESGGFRSAYAWRDVVDTAATLRATAAAARRS